MARQDIYIGVEGNDGTGDSIREAFRKANENFTELYAVFGQGGTITFTALSDTPNTLIASLYDDPDNPGTDVNHPAVVVSNDSGTELVQKRLKVGNGLQLGTTDDTVTITNIGAAVSADTTPILGGPLSGNNIHAIGQVKIDQSAANSFNSTHGTTITVDDLVIDKKFADKNYAPNSLKEGRPVTARDEPTDATEYTNSITQFRNGNVFITGHGYNSGSNGAKFKYSVTGGNAPTNLDNNTDYFIRFVDSNTLELHLTKASAQDDNDLDRVKININNGDNIESADLVGTHTLVDTSYDSDLFGFYKDDEVLPRKHTVKRSGDKLSGNLFLHDHPGDLAGQGAEESDYQAATKYYVDNTSYASNVDLYVTTKGDDAQTNAPVGQEGRAPVYAYRSLQKASQKAEEIIEASALQPGAYRQTITYNGGDDISLTTYSEITNPVAASADAVTLLEENKRFIAKEALQYLTTNYPDSVINKTHVDFPLAEALLIANKKFIQEEVVSWIDDQIAGGQGIWNGFTYNRDKCKRDTGFIIDAWIHDLSRGGNIQTRKQAETYWAGATSRVGGQQQQTNAAINFARDLVRTYILVNEVAPVYQDPPVAETQQTLGDDAESGVDARVVELTAVITDVITGGLTELADPVEETNFQKGTPWEDDITRVIESIIIDIQNNINANLQTVNTGTLYFSSPEYAIKRVTYGTQLRAMYTHVKTITNEIVSNNTVLAGQTRVDQFRDADLSVNQQTKNSIGTKFDQLLTMLEFGLDQKPAIVEGSTFTVRINNGGNTGVDQGLSQNIDILPGKLLLGKNTGALGRIVKYTNGQAGGGLQYDEIEVVLQTPDTFNIGEEIEVGNLTRTAQICIHVETGEYFEDYPIKVPDNVSIKGSDFRRCIIRPANRTSQSPHAKLRFFRDKLLDNLKITDDIGNDLATAQDITIEGENTIGKIIVVTPADNISPLSWEGGWFKTTSGAVGLVIQSNYNGTSFTVQLTKDTLPNLDPITSGNWSIFQTQEFGYHYLTDITDGTSTPKNNLEMDVFLMNDATRLANMTFQGHGGFAQVLDPEGQVLIKSPYMQVCGSFSQSANEQAFRGGMYIDAFTANSEMNIVSKTDNFTLNVSSAVGTGLRIRKPQTPCPFFIGGVRYQVDAITNYDQAAGTATLLVNKLANETNGYTGTSFPAAIILQTGGNRSMLANDYTQVNDLGYGLFVNNGALSEQVSTFTYYNHAAFFCNNGSIIRALNCSNSNGNFGLVAAGSDPNEQVDIVTLSRDMQQPVRVYDDNGDYNHPIAAKQVYVTDCEYAPYNNSLLDHYTANATYTYEVTSVSTVDGVTYNGVKGNNLPIYRLNIGGDEGTEVALNDGDKLVCRMNKNYLFEDVAQVTAIRPSTAIIFDEQEEQVYRSISFSNKDSDGSALQADEFQIVFDSGYDFLNLTLDNTYASRNDFAGSGTTMGDTAGDRVLAITRITSTIDKERLANNDMIFTHAGKTHIVTNYTERTDAGNGNYEYATVTLLDLANSDINSPATGNGLAAGIKFTGGTPATRVIPLSLQDQESATITVAISVLRANGHDFNEIGTGGFNDSNYPNIIYGEPVTTPAQNYQVNEIGKGRVFYVSIDQDGFFRVGKFFEVDQGTGTVTFAASIAISNLDGLGFRRGVRVSEFSNDDTMNDRDPQAVPTEFAVDSFIDRRLGFKRDSSYVGATLAIGPGAVPRDGALAMTGDLSIGSNKITNLSDPINDSDGATKSYVDARTQFDTNAFIGRSTGDLLAFNSSNKYQGATPIGDLVIALDEGTDELNFQIASDSIVNGDIKSNASIAQSKLNMNAATTRNSATGITQADLGLASFQEDRFVSTNGFIDIVNNGIGFNKLVQMSTNTVIGNDDPGTNDPREVSFSTIVENGGSFTTTGVADRIVKTGSDGRIDAQSLYIDSTKILDQSANTLTMTTPGGANLFDSVGTIPSNTTTTMRGSLLIENDAGTAVSQGVQASTFLKNSTYGSNTDATINSSRLATNWIYSSFIEAPAERGAASTGIAIGAGTGFTNSSEVAIIAGNNSPAIIFTQNAARPYANNGYDIGTSTYKFGTFHGTATSAQYADLAENYLADADYEVGTVLVFGGNEEITVTNAKGDRRVAGVVSEHPAHLMNDKLQGNHVTAIALQGRVPVKVIGVVQKGDLLVSAASTGYAIVDNSAKVGTVIGKALEEKTDPGHGVIEAVVGRV